MRIIPIILFLITSSVATSQSLYTVDTQQSTMQWFGYYLFSFGEHNGSIEISKGTLQVNAGQVTGGSFEVNMKSIKSIDMKDEEDGGKGLTDHLMSEDFFSSDKFPVALFEITKVVKNTDNPSNLTGFDVTGFLTLKGTRNELSFPAIIQMENNIVTAKGKFKFDRTKWNIRYNSGKFFSDVGDGAISDAVGIEFTLKAVNK